jgi:DNA-binding protein YbaB
MLDKLEDIKRQTEESNKRLREMTVSESSQNDTVRITMNGHRELVEFKLNGDLSQIENEELEDLVVVTFGRVLDKINKINEQEVMASAKSIFPGL